MKTSSFKFLWPDLDRVSRRNSAVQAVWQEQLGSAWTRLRKLLVAVPFLALGYAGWVVGGAYSEELLFVLKALGAALKAAGGWLIEFRIPYVTSLVGAVLMANVEIRSTLALYALTLQTDLKEFCKQDLDELFDASRPVQGLWLGSIVVQGLLMFAGQRLPETFFMLGFTAACYACSVLVTRYALPAAVKDRVTTDYGLKFSLYHEASQKLVKPAAADIERETEVPPKRVRPEYVY